MVRFLLVLCCLPHLAYAGFGQREQGARPRALGNAYVATASDAWAAFWNPALLAGDSTLEITTSVVPGLYGLSELSTTTVAFKFPFRPFMIGLSARRFGFQLYRETSVGFALAYAAGDFGIGAAAYIDHLAIGRYGSAWTVTFDVGISGEPIHHLVWASSVSNVTSSRIGTSREPLPQSVAAGLGYRISPQLTLALEYRKATSLLSSLRCGCEFIPVEPLALRCGMSDVPAEYSAGFGVRYGMLAFDYGMSIHQVLGSTHEVTLSLRWGGHS